MCIIHKICGVCVGIHQHIDFLMIGCEVKMNRPGREETENRIIEIVTEMFRNSAGYNKDVTVSAKSQIQDELGFDSIMLIVLQIDIEDAFHIRFDPVEEDLQQVFLSVRTLTDSVQSHMGV